MEPTTHGLVWTVTDDGPAVSPEELPRLFEPFGHNRPANLGLDFGLVAKLVQMHGGSIGGTNRPEGGLAIQVRIRAEG